MTETVSLPQPTVVVPSGLTADPSIALHTGTACLAFIDPHFVDEVWEDLLYDGHDHDHGAGGLALNSASMATHVEYDGDFPMTLFRDDAGFVRAVEVKLDPYSESWATPAVTPAIGHDEDDPDGAHDHEHFHDDDVAHAHEHNHDDTNHDTGHGSGHGSGHGWSTPSTVTLITDRVHAGDPAGLPQADDTGGLVDLIFPAAGGRLDVAVLSEEHTRTLLRMVWVAPGA